MNALWGLGHMMMLTRVLLVVDHDVDPADVRGVVWNALNNVDASRDLVIMPGPVDDLDHSASYGVAMGHKLGIDATRKTAAEGYQRVWPPDITMDAPTRELVDRRWHEYGLRTRYEGDAWSGQGEAALRRLLESVALVPGSIDPAALRAEGVRALEGGR
jgi:3-polyprenyl-4-hydroxybenzoate decarboxylase